MTREEAIEQLKLTRAANKCNYADKYILDAFDMAIKSLEAWEKVRMEIILEGKKNYTNSIFNKGLYRAIEIIDKYSEVSE